MSFTKINLRLTWGSADWSLYIYNILLGNTYIKSLPKLRCSDSIFTLTCTFLVVNEVKMTLDPWPVHTLQHNTKIVSGLDIRRKL